MRTSSNSKAKRTIALVFLLCFFMVALLSETFVLLNAQHEHDHYDVNNECVVCAHIQSVENLLKQFGTAVSMTLLGLAGLFAVLAMLYFLASSIAHQTPVYLKIRLNS